MSTKVPLPLHYQRLASSGEDSSSSSSMDPLLLVLNFPYNAHRVPCMRLKVPSFSLPSAMTVFSLILATYFLVVSGFIYNVIVKPPDIGSLQDHVMGNVEPVGFLFRGVNGQYIFEGLSSGFMFLLGGVGIILLHLALDKHRARIIKVSFVAAGVSSLAITYIMSMLFICIKISSYLQ